jgi:hypothetical protein
VSWTYVVNELIANTLIAPLITIPHSAVMGISGTKIRVSSAVIKGTMTQYMTNSENTRCHPVISDFAARKLIAAAWPMEIIN